MKWVSRIVANPLFAISGWIIGIAGAWLTWKTVETTELCWTVQPGQSTIVQAGQASPLRVSFHDEAITNDITLTKIQIWNGGRKSIRRANLLEPLQIVLDRIYEANFTDITRSNILKPKLVLGITNVIVEWDILESGDGFVVKLLHEGAKQPSITGAVENQKAILRKEFKTRPSKLMVIGSPVAGAFFAWAGLRDWKKFRKTRREGVEFIAEGLLCCLLFWMAFNSMWLAWFATSPPFSR